jgi:Histone methylation protein DOT1
MPYEDEITPVARKVTSKESESSSSIQTDESSDDNSDNLLVVQPSNPRKITPGTVSATKRSKHALASTAPVTLSAVKKKLFGSDDGVLCVTPAREINEAEDNNSGDGSRKRSRFEESPAKRRLVFWNSQITINKNVRSVYKIVRQRTGSIGGNGCFGPIYGELTTGSMQKIINMMKEHTNFDSSSLFIDIGSGIGKPNLHVSQDPGVQVSLGIESEDSRWILSMNCLQGVVDAVDNQLVHNSTGDICGDNDKLLSCNCLFIREDVMNVQTFNPFTHVYMFSIG